MDSTYVKVGTREQIDSLAALAGKIWREHFQKMFTPEELEFLIKQVQSKEAIQKQISEGRAYFFINRQGVPVGYFAYYVNPAEKEIFLSKLYVSAGERGKGIGRQVVRYLEEECAKSGIAKITLTVFHKNEGAIKAYEKMGFKNVGFLDRVFGGCLKCRDYKMEKEL